jgi:hypothetical protein
MVGRRRGNPTDGSSQIRRNLQRKKSVVELPVVIGAQANQVALGIDRGNQCVVWEFRDAALVANLDMRGVAANTAPERQARIAVHAAS